MEKVKIEMTYKNLTTYEFSQLMVRLANYPTTGPRAKAILEVVQSTQKVRNGVTETYKKDVMEKFGEKDETGKIKIDPESGFICIPGQETALREADLAFGEEKAVIETVPLNSMVIGEFKLSAKEIELLGGLFVDQAGPGLPQGLSAVR